MKRVIFLGLLILILIGIPCSATCEYKRGDANGDGVIGIGDLLLIRQYLAGFDIEICYENAASVDTRHPDNIGTCDSLLVAQYLAGLRDENFNWV